LIKSCAELATTTEAATVENHEITSVQYYHVTSGGVVDIERSPHPTVIKQSVRITDIRIPVYRNTNHKHMVLCHFQSNSALKWFITDYNKSVLAFILEAAMQVLARSVQPHGESV